MCPATPLPLPYVSSLQKGNTSHKFQRGKFHSLFSIEQAVGQAHWQAGTRLPLTSTRVGTQGVQENQVHSLTVERLEALNINFQPIQSTSKFYSIGLSHFWISAARTPFVRFFLLEFG